MERTVFGQSFLDLFMMGTIGYNRMKQRLKGVDRMSLRSLSDRVRELTAALDSNRIQQEKKAEQRKGIALGLTTGAILGGLAGIFFAPDKGENTRQKTREELLKAKEKVEEELRETKIRLEESLEQGKDKAAAFYAETKEVLEDKAQDIKDRLQKEKEEVVEQAEKKADEVSSRVDEAAEKAKETKEKVGKAASAAKDEFKDNQ